jgi:thioredoxin 1
MDSVEHINDSDFDAKVLKQTGLVLVDFWAAWCGPCKMIAPILEQIADEMKDTVKVVKMNVDDNQQIASKYRIMSIPTLILFKDGKLIEQLVGVRPKEQIKKLIEKSTEKH